MAAVPTWAKLRQGREAYNYSMSVRLLIIVAAAANPQSKTYSIWPHYTLCTCRFTPPLWQNTTI